MRNIVTGLRRFLSGRASSPPDSSEEKGGQEASEPSFQPRADKVRLSRRKGIRKLAIGTTPVGVIDMETTGLTAGADRVIEVSVVRIDPGEAPHLVLDTLVNPRRPVAATRIHGITDADVKNAPHFHEIAGEIVGALKGCVVAAYNVYFDIGFLNFELANAGIQHVPPHFCLMWMRPLLGLGRRRTLNEVCTRHGIDYDLSHVAAQDAMASARLFQVYLQEMANRDIQTYGDLAKLHPYKFFRSFKADPLPAASALGLAGSSTLKSRAGYVHESFAEAEARAVREYYDVLMTVVEDLEITDEELDRVRAARSRLGLAEEQVRVLHARVFTAALNHFCGDEWLDDDESKMLKQLHRCLKSLGWAPGQ